jgi:hypothetical protein
MSRQQDARLPRVHERNSSSSATLGEDWLPRVPDFWHSEKRVALGKFSFSRSVDGLHRRALRPVHEQEVLRLQVWLPSSCSFCSYIHVTTLLDKVRTWYRAVASCQFLHARSFIQIAACVRLVITLRTTGIRASAESVILSAQA